MDIDTLTVIAAFSSACKFAKLVDWLRLFEKTSFYVLLVVETVIDIGPFMLLFFTALMMFGMPVLMLNQNREEGSDLMDEPFGFWLMNIVLHQYLLALGEYSMDNFSENEDKVPQPQTSLCYVFFFLAVFVT